MRVVIVNPAWDQAQVTPVAAVTERSTLTGWAAAVRYSGAHSVTVLQRFPTDATVERDGVAYEFCATRRLHDTVLAADPDVVHINGFAFPELIRGLRAVLPQRTALVAQNDDEFDPATASALTRIRLRRGLAAVDAVLVPTLQQAEALRRSRLVLPETVVAEIMDRSTALQPMPRTLARARTGIDGEPALLWVSPCNETTDPLTVLRGAAVWFRDCPRATLTMVMGSGPLDDEVRRCVETTPELARRVTLVGAVSSDRLTEYYSAADVFVLGSHQPCGGTAVIAALACGTVPVVTDVELFQSLTNDGAIGALWEPGNSTAFVSALNRVVTRPLWEQKQRARDRFHREFSWAVIGRRAVALYRDVIASRVVKNGPAHTRWPA